MLNSSAYPKESKRQIWTVSPGPHLQQRLRHTAMTQGMPGCLCVWLTEDMSGSESKTSSLQPKGLTLSWSSSSDQSSHSTFCCFVFHSSKQVLLSTGFIRTVEASYSVPYVRSSPRLKKLPKRN